MQSMNEYAIPFAAWELRLYLDTHPDDARALAMYRQLCRNGARSHYACVPGCEGGRWGWIDSPWPWEPEANETEGCR